MATRFLLASVPKTHPKTKASQHLTPFSAVAASRFLPIPRLEASRILETIYEDQENAAADHVVVTSGSVSASFLVSNMSTCYGHVKKQLSSNSLIISSLITL
ncbi:hypothetical protein R6Q57_027967 [Mikania cordata]